jgi:hypothetical protein
MELVIIMGKSHGPKKFTVKSQYFIIIIIILRN